MRTRELEQLADALTKQVARQLSWHLGWLGFSCATRGQAGDERVSGAREGTLPNVQEATQRRQLDCKARAP